jgi:tricorn protease
MRLIENRRRSRATARRRSIARPSLGLGCVVAALAAAAAPAETLLLRSPAISETQLAFVYAGDLWVANRDGSRPRRLTSHPADEGRPHFSPDGSMIAFTASYENNEDVYVVPAVGGQPTRLTWHPGPDTVMGWSADGTAVAFASAREKNHGRSAQLYHVSRDGGMPVKQMEARFFQGRWDERGRRLAYIAHGSGYNGLFGGTAGWRGYRGGTTPSLMVLDPTAKTVTTVPGAPTRSTDFNPMWRGDTVFFLSDRGAGKVFNIYSFDTGTGRIVRHTNEREWDIRAADLRGGTIVYEAGGRLKSFDIASARTKALRISIAPDLPQRREQWKDAIGALQSVAFSPTGKRALLTARGEVFTVPTDEGSTRNVSVTGSVREYTALWSPDGQQIAYIADEGGMQSLVLEDQGSLEPSRKLVIGTDFYTLLDWTRDGRYVVFSNNHLRLFAMDLQSGTSVQIGEASRREGFDVASSPDGRWLAFTREGPNFNRDLLLWDFEKGKATAVTAGMADTGAPAFSHDGKYLFFTASTNSGPAQVGLDMSSQERPYRAGLYAVVLAADGKSPLLPGTGDEPADRESGDAGGGDAADTNAAADADGDTENAAAEAQTSKATQIDLDGIAGRIVALPVAEASYDNLAAAADGSLLYLQRTQPGVADLPPGQDEAAGNRLMRFDFEEKKATAVFTGLEAFVLAHDGKHLLIRKPGNGLATAEVAAQIEAKDLDVSGVRVRVDPRAEWAFIFDEVWRMERAFFYDPDLHGLDWRRVRARYLPLVEHVGRREDLNALMVEMIGEMQVGHNRVGGGDVHREQGTNTGLLGVDLRTDGGDVRIARLYDGEAWNPFLRGPLAAPGLDLGEGDYILGVNGARVDAGDNLFALLAGTAGQQVTLTVAPAGARDQERNVVVEPVEDERLLRLWSWIEDNRRAVTEATGGRVGYVYLPNTAGAGYTLFNRMFFAQVDREAMIIDERSNGGGQAANYITDVLSRTYLSSWKDRDGLLFQTPGGAMYGPKVMLIDQDAGSGGDFLPYSFRHMKIGTLMGTRTWGGLIGIATNPRLMDDGALVVPFFRFIDADGNWSVENEGVPPDIEVMLDPVAANAGRDTQLEAAITEVMRQLETARTPVPSKAPPYPKELGQ